jgi:hypothetical protein
MTVLGSILGPIFHVWTNSPPDGDEPVNESDYMKPRFTDFPRDFLISIDRYKIVV